MDRETTALADFVLANRGPLAGFLRQKILATGGQAALERLGKDGIEAMEAEAAGVLLDLACALLRRLQPGRRLQAEELLVSFPEATRRAIHLPRSDAYRHVLEEFHARRDI